MSTSRSLLFLALVACSGGGSNDSGGGATPPGGPLACGPYELAADGACVGVGFTACPDGFASDATKTSCVETLSTTCKANELPALGGACTRVGATTCASGFVPDATGLGCAPASATTVCAGATREDFGGCVPIGDCSAAFPPPGATYFVDDSFGAGQLDATHVTTISAALAAAPAGATIAIEAGTYAEPLAFTKAVTLVGRCAAQVTLQGSAAAAAGLRVAGATGIVVRGLHVTGFEPGVDVDGGGSIDVEESLLDANRRNGAQVLGSKSHLGFARSAIRGSLVDASAKFGVGASAGGGAELVLDATGIADNREIGVFATDAGTTAKLTRVRVTTTHPRGTAFPAIALSVQGGAHADVAESAFEASTSGAVSVIGSTLVMKSSAVAGVAAGAGVSAAAGADVTLDGSFVTGFETVGVDVSASKVTLTSSGIVGGPKNAGGVDTRSKSTVTMSATGVSGARGFAIAARDASTLDATSVLVSGTRDNQGIAYAAVAYSGGVLGGHGLVIDDTTGTSLVVLGAGSKATLDRSIIRRTQLSSQGSLGVAALAEKGGDLTLTSTVIRETDALGIVIRASTAKLDGVVVHDTKGQNDALSGTAFLALDDSTVTIDNAAFDANAMSSVLIAGAKTTVTATGVSISHTRVDTSNNAGRGVTVQDGATATFTRAAILDNAEAALGAFQATARVTSSIIEATHAVDGHYGHGAFCVAGRMDLDRTVVRKQDSVGVVYADGSGVVRASTIADNAVGLHVQGTTTLVTGPAADDPPDGDVLVSDDSIFDGNGSRLGDGDVPLPAPLVTPQ